MKIDEMPGNCQINVVFSTYSENISFLSAQILVMVFLKHF